MWLLGLNIGGTNCSAVLGEADGDGITLYGRQGFATAETRAPRATVDRLIGLARALLARNRLDVRQVSGLGISCGGPLDSRSGVIQSPPNLPGWDDVPVVHWCEDALGVHARLENDANACALAEWRWGAGRGCRHMIFLTFGTGLGAGLILNGRLYDGACGLAGEVGHVRMAEDGPVGHQKAGSFEGFCSGGGIARAAAAHGLDASAAEVFAAAEAGDARARPVIEQTGQYLGRGLAMLIDVLNPERLVLGSIFTRQRDVLWPIAEAVLRAEALPQSLACCQVLPAALGDSIGDYGALAVAPGLGVEQ
jgi:glucokinase